MTNDADAEERLDTMALLAAADPADMLRQVASSAAQVRAAVRATQEADLTEIIAAGRPRAARFPIGLPRP